MIDLKLDTLHKKPKVYNLAFLSAAVAVLLSFLFPSFVVTFHFDTLAFLLMSASV